MKVLQYLALFTLVLATPPAQASDELRPLVGDPDHGRKLFEANCKSRYKKTGLGLFTSDEMNLSTDDELYKRVREGDCITKEQKAKFDGSALSHLDAWDVVAFIRTLHLNLSDFFPDAARYISKVYEIDKYGLGRIAEAAKPLPKGQQKASVFTFFRFEGEGGNLRHVPQDPILLDELKRDKKTGYLVFLPMKHDGFDGEVGIGMDPKGVILKMMVHPDAPKAELLNASLARFEGMGRKGQTQPFRVSGGKNMKALAKVVFPLYLRAMETVTMYDRDENERNWAQ